MRSSPLLDAETCERGKEIPHTNWKIVRATGILLSVFFVGGIACTSLLSTPSQPNVLLLPEDLDNATFGFGTLGRLQAPSSLVSPPLAIPASRLSPYQIEGRLRPVSNRVTDSMPGQLPHPWFFKRERHFAVAKSAAENADVGLEADEKAKIVSIVAREVLDSRGNPTVEAELTTGYGTVSAMVPSGASTGIYEALEMRDGGSRYNGKGVVTAIENIRTVIAPELMGKDVRLQRELDEFMTQKLDGTQNEWGWVKSKLGANAILAVSMCLARAGAEAFGLELYEYIGELKETKGNPSGVDVTRARERKYKMPVPMMNVINGGVHAGNTLPMQEFMIAPVGASSFKQALQIGTEVYHSLKGVVKSRYGKDAAAVGDEGGFAPNIQKNEEEGLQCLMDAIKDAGHLDMVKLAMDVAASEFYDQKDGTYNLGFKIDNPPPGLVKTKSDMVEFYKGIVAKYPLVSIEDPFDQDDWDAWTELVGAVGTGVQIVADDLTVTNPKRIEVCQEKKAANALLLKVNQIGTITESITASLLSVADHWGVMVSHRSGETEDTFIADLSVGLSTGQIKTGAPCRSERVAKYNRLLRIEDKLGSKAVYAGEHFRES